MESDDNDGSRDDAPFYGIEHPSFQELKLGLSNNKVILDIPSNIVCILDF
jgi:hypothetical protein